MLNFRQPKRHQITSIDEFTTARIHRLWDSWAHRDSTQRGSKRQFHRHVIAREPGLERVSLATVYVLIARFDAQSSTTSDASYSPA